jgi:hypothetical protein
MYPRELQGENCAIVGSCLYSDRDMQGKMLIVILISRYTNAIGIPTKSGRQTVVKTQT